MTCAIDIGNSTIGFAFLKEGRLERVCKIENELASELVRVKLANFLESAADRYSLKRVVICSVVPEVLKKLSARIVKAWGLRPVVVGRDVKIPIKNRYQSPRQVGKDRLLCAFAARELYGAPAVVIDLGTAITFDGVSPAGDYLGGAIIPGLRLSAEALFEKTALLPRVHIAEPRKVIGATTEESIQSGLFHGYGSLCDGMVVRLGEEMKCRPKVVMTGGNALVMRRFMKHAVMAVDEDLIFKGMSLLVA
ncbi:MAG: type III pantothenate kinase [Candidatus Omnitrophica bacterium]|nr:type III pantothenate kinase [Candidatus Omnitrophota bacterium]